jgi:signal transduction histidine kinase
VKLISLAAAMRISTNDMYPQLLSLAVHEFRSPTSVVSGYLRMLQKDKDLTLSDRQRKMIDEAEKSCGRLAELIQEMSDIGKLDAGIIALAREPLDIFTLVGDVAGLVQEAKDRDVHLEVRGAADGARIYGDAVWLRTAFNAIFRAILREKRGSTTVIADRQLESRGGTTSAVVVVADAETLPAARDRTPVPFDEKRGGLGLALPLARRVIEGHGGRIWSPEPAGSETEDAAVAKGTAIISLPVTE